MNSSTTWFNLDIHRPIWDCFHSLAPLYVIGTRDADGKPDLAPKPGGAGESGRHSWLPRRQQEALPTVEAEKVPCPLLKDAYLHLECELDRIISELGRNVLIIGRVVHARVEAGLMVEPKGDAHKQFENHPLPAYVTPGRFASVRETHVFPFPQGFSR